MMTARVLLLVRMCRDVFVVSSRRQVLHSGVWRWKRLLYRTNLKAMHLSQRYL